MLIERVRKAAARVLCGRGLLAAYVFGSRSTGSARPDSDLDIGYYLQEGRGDLARFAKTIAAHPWP